MPKKAPDKLPPHITKLENGKYRVRYKRTEKYPVSYDKTFDTYEEADEANSEYLAKIKLRVYTKNTKDDIGFSDFCDYVIDWYRKKQKAPSQNTLTSYRKYMTILKGLLNNIKLRDITPYRIEMILSEEKSRQKLGNGALPGETISANTLHHEYTMLRMVLNKAFKWGFIEMNPINAVEEPTFEEKEIVVPEYEQLEEIESLIMTAPIKERCQFLLAFFTGMREAEVSGLHIKDFDFEKKTVSIKRTIVQNDETREFEEGKTKSKSSVRTIPLPNRFFKVLNEYLEYRENYVKMLKIKTNGEYQEIPNLFLNKDGDFCRPSRIGRSWYLFRKKHNLTLTFHGLRHYYLTNQMNYNDKLAPRDVQQLAGHSNIKTTFKYVHPSQENIYLNAPNLFDKFTKDKLYKNGNGTMTIPITHIATIILGEPKYSKIEELQITLSELSKEEVNFFNISKVMENSKTYLLANYPSLIKIEKYKNSNKNEKEIIDSITKEFGSEFEIETYNELEIDMK